MTHVVERYFDLRNIIFVIMVCKVISYRRKVQIHHSRELVRESVRRRCQGKNREKRLKSFNNVTLPDGK